jgi:hypothetical protein
MHLPHVASNALITVGDNNPPGLSRNRLNEVVVPPSTQLMPD